SFLYSTVLYFFNVDPGAVIRDLDHDTGSGIVSLKQNSSMGRLACLLTVLRHFNSVVYTVAEQVEERIRKLVDDRLVYFGISAYGFKHDVLAHLLRQVAYETLEAHDKAIHRHEAHLQGAVA